MLCLTANLDIVQSQLIQSMPVVCMLFTRAIGLSADHGMSPVPPSACAYTHQAEALQVMEYMMFTLKRVPLEELRFLCQSLPQCTNSSLRLALHTIVRFINADPKLAGLSHFIDAHI